MVSLLFEVGVDFARDHAKEPYFSNIMNMFGEKEDEDCRSRVYK
jgi:hypothetical protein